MIDPISTLAPRFKSALVAAFGDAHADLDPALRRSERTDVQANVAMSLAKRLGKPPRAVAEALVAVLDVSDVCDRVEIAGPGFINLTLSSSFVAAQATRMAEDPRLGIALTAAPETVVIDYSSPNVAKELHVGHLRGTILGDAIVRVLSLVGHRVIRQNHLGDWGTPFGMMIEHMIDVGAEAAAAIDDWNAFYRAARARFDGDPDFAERARGRVVLLQAHDAPTLALWQRLVDQSKRYLQRVYALLGVTLTDADYCGESFYNDALPGVVRDLEALGLLVESEGASCVFPPGFTGKGGDPLPLIVRKKDGGYGYPSPATSPRSATAPARWAERRLLYVVGAPQRLHLEMVFAVSTTAGWLKAPVRAQHVAFGAILGADKKMYKTRSGESVALLDLLGEATEAAQPRSWPRRTPTCRRDERAEVARAVGIGAVKYADLSTDRVKDYVFDWDRMLAFEGNTAPYLQYAHARICSIFRRSDAPAPGGRHPGHRARGEGAGPGAPRFWTGGARRGGDAPAAQAVHVPLRRGARLHALLRTVPGAQGRHGRSATLAPRPVRPDRARPGPGAPAAGDRRARAHVDVASASRAPKSSPGSRMLCSRPGLRR